MTLRLSFAPLNPISSLQVLSNKKWTIECVLFPQAVRDLQSFVNKDFRFFVLTSMH
jgi:hypothetical protein